MEVMIVTFSMVSLILSVISLIMGIVAFVELRSFMKSTHKIDFLPLESTAPIKKERNADDELERYGII